MIFEKYSTSHSISQGVALVEDKLVRVGNEIVCPDGVIRDILGIWGSTIAYPSGTFIEAGELPCQANNFKWKSSRYFGVMDSSNFRLP